MPIAVEKALAADPAPVDISWDESRVLLYHLALGAGNPPTDPLQLRYAYEGDLQVLPTFAVVAGAGAASGGGGLSSWPGLDINLHNLLHGEQEVEVHARIPTAGEARSTTRITDIWDKGKAAVLRMQTETVTPDGAPLFTTRMSLFVRGEGGFGGDRGPSVSIPVPERTPDHVVETPTLPQQALLYRLTGDRNPLHADPEFAALAGFSQPILHGLCSYGMVCRAVVDGVLGGATERLRSYSGRFADVVYPGETIVTSVWEEADRLVLAAVTAERGTPVLTNAVVTVS
jgi:acyl dehydratase